MSRVLIVDDEPAICWAFQRALTDEGLEVKTMPTAEGALELMPEFNPDLVVLDVRLPGLDGLSALARIRKLAPTLPVLVMTAFGNLDTAVQAISQGACEYLTKPFDLEDAVCIVKQILTASQSTTSATDDPVASSNSGNSATGSVNVTGGSESPLSGLLLGQSPKMQAIFRRIAIVVEHDVPVLISGESGTGKELVAMAIHRYGPRADGPFIPVCLPALPDNLIESELFGHAKGAFTGADAGRPGLLTLAHQGTAFLDEMGDIPLAMQVKLLRVLETRQVLPVGSGKLQTSNFRLLAATNRNLEALVAAGEFRADLYHRLNVFRIELPPLRERDDDVILLAKHFLSTLKGPSASFSERMLAELRHRPWYGNVRELKHAIEHAAILSRSNVLEPESLPPAAPQLDNQVGTPGSLSAACVEWFHKMMDRGTTEGLYDQFLELCDPILLREALQHSNGNRQEAARLLGMHRQTLRDRLKKHHLDTSED
ncbi:MAG: sigma-54 dependent transcriptional regulator [Planctomycetaceae bacterium]